MRVRLNPLPVLTVLTVIAFAALIVLGQWQWARYEEKRLLKATVPDVVALEPFTPLPDSRQLVFGIREGAPGWRVFEPVRYGDRTVFVDVGYIAGFDAPDWRAIPPAKALAEARAVSGEVVRPKPPSALAPKADPARRLWYQVDLAAMAAAAGLTGAETYYVAMPYIGPTGAAETNPFAHVGVSEALPPERHLGYAVTWWGLAAALVGVYLAFHARQGRLVIK
jgi:surfeit locus 1 family protein